MAPVIGLISDLVATLAGVLAIWLGIKVLKDGKAKNDDTSEREHGDTSDRDRRDDPEQ